MNNKHAKSKTALLGGIVAIFLASPLAHAQIIFFDDFSEDTTTTYTEGLAGMYNNLTNAPMGAPTNELDWSSTPALNHPYEYQYGSGNEYSDSNLGYAVHTTATNGSNYEVYLAPGGNGTAQSNDPSDLTTPILTSTGAAVNLVSGDSYTLSLDVGDRSDLIMSDLGIDLFAGSTLLDPNETVTVTNVDGSTNYTFTDEVTLSQLSTTNGGNGRGAFSHFSFTIPASALAGDSGALSLEFVNLADQSQVNLSNIELSETAAPEPGTWAVLLGGLGALFSFQRLRRGLKV